MSTEVSQGLLRSNIAAAGTAVTREFTTRGRNSRERDVCIVLFAVVFRGKAQKRRLVPKDTSSWGSGAPFPPLGEENRGNPKVPESLGNPSKTLLLLKSCRSVPPTLGTPRADREIRLTGTRILARFLHHGAAPSPRAPGPGRRES